MVVAEITKDHLFDRWEIEGINDDPSQSHVGKQFDYEAMQAYWDWPANVHAALTPKVGFKLYDDDDELYYSGWLLNDDQCIVQQFVLAWAQADSGCTTILVHKNKELGYIQEIG